jgi:predicted dehydrogenase
MPARMWTPSSSPPPISSTHTTALKPWKAGRDAYVEKPTAHTMADARMISDAVKKSGKIVQVGTQRRSTPAYQKAAEYIKSGQFGDIVMVEMSWNVNQPGRWRRPDVVPLLKEEDTDWKRYSSTGIPGIPFDARKYLEFRLFWPYSSGIPDQWLVHQIDTVHWFTGLPHPRSCVANGGIYLWKDGRTNWDTMTAVFDYGPLDDLTKGFQVQYTSRFTNSAGGVKELYYSNGGMIDMDKQTVTPTGGLTADRRRDEDAAQPAAQLLAGGKGRDRETDADTHGDPQTPSGQHAQLDGVRALAQDAERADRSGLQPFHRAVHERRRHPDRHEGDLRRQDAAGDGRGQGVCVGTM